MKEGGAMRILCRAGGAFVLSLALVLVAPAAWLVPISPLVAVATDALSPHLEMVSVDAEGAEMHAQGKFHLDLTLSNGEGLPDFRAWWRKAVWKVRGVLVVAVTIWACPFVGWRRRLLLFPVMLAAAACVSADDLGIEIQETILRDLVPKVLQDSPLAQSVANQTTLDQLNTWHQWILRVRQINEGGGRMFLAILAGWIGYAIPLRTRLFRN